MRNKIKSALLPFLLVALAFVSGPALVIAATTGTTTDTAKTAPPLSVSLTAGSQLMEAGLTGDKKAFARANHVHNVTGVLPISNGGTGVSTLTCSAGQVLTSDGSTQSCYTLPVAGGTGSTGATIPTTATYLGGRTTTGTMAGVKICDLSAAINAAAGGGAVTTKVIDGTSGQKIYICGVYVVASATTSLKFVEATNSGCSTGVADVTGWAALPAAGGFAVGLTPFAVPFMSTAGNYLCVSVNSAAQVGGWISYTLAP